jgi:predicted ATPase
VITKLKIEGLRGIREGELSDLAPLTILVGPSGSGKSTILDALLIVAANALGDAIGRAVNRRAELLGGASWLFYRRHETARLEVEQEGRLRAYSLRRSPVAEEIVCDVMSAGADRTQVVLHDAKTTFDVWNAYEPLDGGHPLRLPSVRLIEPQAGAVHPALYKLFGEAKQRGQHIAIRETLKDVVPGALDLSINTVTSGDRDLPYVEIEYADHTVPVAAAGSGIYGLLRLVIELSVQPGGLALVEEPEVHQHPAAIHQSAKALLVAVRRGVQVVVSTHSLDLIDSLLAHATPEDLERLVVFRVVTRDGVLLKSSFPGAVVATARQDIDEDLR